MRLSIWLVGALALVACSDDEGPSDPEIDGGRPDGSIDASSDASSDGGSDSGLDCSPLAGTYKFGTEGGNAPWHDVYTLSGSTSVKLDRVPWGFGNDAGVSSCSGSLAACGTAALDITDITSALRDAASFWGDGSRVYGEDPRPGDGQVLVVERVSDGKKILVGGACTGAPGFPCTERPQAIAQLRSVFDRLRTEIALGDQGDGGLAGSCTR
jgi:hypothetical protein